MQLIEVLHIFTYFECYISSVFFLGIVWRNREWMSEIGAKFLCKGWILVAQGWNEWKRTDRRRL